MYWQHLLKSRILIPAGRPIKNSLWLHFRRSVRKKYMHELRALSWGRSLTSFFCAMGDPSPLLESNLESRARKIRSGARAPDNSEPSQPTNPASQPVSQPASQPASQPSQPSQPDNQLTSEPVNLLTRKPLNQLTSEPIDQ